MSDPRSAFPSSARRLHGGTASYAAPYVVPLGALLALLAVLLSPSGASADPPTSPVTTDPADAAAGWLTGELVDGNHMATEFDLDGNGQIDPATEVFADYGLTADAILAFASAGSAGNAADAATDYLAVPENIASYAGDGGTESYAGSLAKLILIADVMGRDPAALGGRDLISELLAREQADGRYSDASAFGDFSNPITQSLAIIALDRIGIDASAQAVDFLASVQCADGGFVTDLSVLPCATGEVDATAFAVQAFALSGRDAEADTAVAYLLGQQAADGSFAAPGFGSPPVTTANSNSTGLAAQALRTVGEDDAADRAVSWLLDRQVGTDGPREQQGAFAFDATGFDAGNATRATTQAILGLSGIGFADLVAPTDPLAYGLAGAGPPPPPTGGGGAVPPPGPPPPADGGPPPPAGGSAAGDGAAQLPATGAAPVALLGIGSGLLVIGIAATMFGRRPTRTST